MDMVDLLGSDVDDDKLATPNAAERRVAAL
jgi:hypothetical protein